MIVKKEQEIKFITFKLLFEMATRAAREKNSHLNEHHKKILADLMGEEANMHCADCRRKGKRVPPVAVFCHEKILEKKKENWCV